MFLEVCTDILPCLCAVELRSLQGGYILQYRVKGIKSCNQQAAVIPKTAPYSIFSSSVHQINFSVEHTKVSSAVIRYLNLQCLSERVEFPCSLATSADPWPPSCHLSTGIIDILISNQAALLSPPCSLHSLSVCTVSKKCCQAT